MGLDRRQPAHGLRRALAGPLAITVDATTLWDVAIVGMVDPANERLSSIDVRPKTGVLYGVSTQRRIYTIDPFTGGATLVDVLPIGTARPLQHAMGIDFDPTIDELRIGNGGRLNRRWNPDTRVVTEGTDLSLMGVVAIAYTNHLSGTQSDRTMLYGVTGTTAFASAAPWARPPRTWERSPEISERFAVTLQAPSIGIRFGEIATITITIEDDENPPNPPPTIDITTPSPGRSCERPACRSRWGERPRTTRR